MDRIEDSLQRIYMTGPIGQMVWKGLFGGTKTFSGLDFDIAKSAVQKYIRRNIPQKALLSAIEIYRLQEVGGNSAVKNLYNRLSIIANEDIGPAALELVLKVTDLVETNNIKDVFTLLAIVQLLAESKKTRLMSHAWTAYATPDGRKIAESKGLHLDKDLDLEYIKENINSSESSELFLPSDPIELRNFVLMFLKRLNEADFNAYTWVYFFFEYCVNNNITKVKFRPKFIGSTRSKTSKPDILLWKALSKVLPSNTYNILVNAYYKHKESRPFLEHAILIAIYKIPYKDFNIEPYVESWKQKKEEVQQMLNGNYELQVDDFVIDKHTRKGRLMGKNIKDFIQEGSKVIPEDPKFSVPILEEVYKS
ncbi:MAG: hypothetical protein QXV60_02180 [Nitrososphaerota archaeon]